MLIRILLGLVVVVIALVVVVATRPAEFRIARTTTVAAPPRAVFAQVNDFHRWDAWSPWAKLDPAMKQTFEGPPAGTGAIYTWSGDRQVGEGRMTMIESRPDELIRIELQFVRPFRATNTAEFTFRPEGDRTIVTWSMTGRNGFMAKAVGLFVSMDRLVGREFESGLSRLAAVAEASAR